MQEIRMGVENMLTNSHVSTAAIPYLTFFIFLAVTIGFAALCVYATRIFLLKVVSKIVKRTPTDWDDYLFAPPVYKALSLIVGVIVFRILIPAFFSNLSYTMSIMLKVVDVYFIYILLKIVIVTLKTLQEKLSTFKSFEDKPLTSYFQLIKMIIIIAGIIYVVSILIGKSPLYLLSAFGAMTAILLLIFKDTILGLVASIQISVYDMVRVGDWVAMPEFNTDGSVLAINLNTVKIMNWDKTVSTVPTYNFVTESFRNYRSMQESGGRRIMRTLRIDVNSITFVDDDMRKKLEKVEILKSYIAQNQSDIEEFNQKKSINTDVLINGRRMTNIGVFRQYIQCYLEHHPDIHNPSDRPEMYQIVRQLASDQNGIPLQICCFTKTVSWGEYEPIQSDIFDHLFAAASFFDLSIFQSPTGKDFRAFNDK